MQQPSMEARSMRRYEDQRRLAGKSNGGRLNPKIYTIINPIFQPIRARLGGYTIIIPNLTLYASTDYDGQVREGDKQS